MNATELTDDELLLLVVLAKCIIHADGEVSNTELLDLMSLGDVVGMERLEHALNASEGRYQDLEAVGRMATAFPMHPDTKVFMFVLLEELAKGDGLGDYEQFLLNDLRRLWEI